MAAVLAVGCTSSKPESRPPEVLNTPSETSSSSRASGGPTDATPGSTPSSGETGSQGNGGTGGQVDDPDTRRTVAGHAPRYVEIDSASLGGLGDQLEMILSLDGPIPDRLPNGRSSLRISFSLTAKTGKRFWFAAQASETGWQASHRA